MSSIIAEFIPTLFDIFALNNDILSIIKGVFNLTYFTYVFAIGILFFYKTINKLHIYNTDHKNLFFLTKEFQI